MNKSWSDYIIAIGGQKPPASNIDNSAFSNTEGGPPTGFVEWKPKNMEIQKRYDAMSGSWEGITASEKNATKVFKTEYAPFNK